MSKKNNTFSALIARQIVIILITIILLSSSTLGQNDDQLRLAISDPGQVPGFDNFHTPTIIPGETGKLRFTITNRYDSVNFTKYFKNEDVTLWDYAMYNVSLILNIYEYATLETNKDVEKISHAPQITGGNTGLRDITNPRTANFFWLSIDGNESVPVEISIKSFQDSPQGRYFIRMHMNFTFDDKYFDMKSRGHFTDELWDLAQQNITDEEGAYNDSDGVERFVVGRLDLNKLKVDGLIPDTSVRILEPFPLWPLYVFIGLVIFFAVMAVVFYYMDEKGKFPGTKKKLDDLGEKAKNFRNRRE